MEQPPDALLTPAIEVTTYNHSAVFWLLVHLLLTLLQTLQGVPHLRDTVCWPIGAAL